MEQTKLTYEQQTELAGYYDDCASYFGGDPIIKVEEKYFKGDKLGYLNWLKRVSTKIKKDVFFGSTFKLYGKNITIECGI